MRDESIKNVPDDSLPKKAGLSLFPKRQKDLETNCSCPDWSNPCKHIAAVFYLMAEAFDKDPFLLFKLRGMEREEFLNALQDSSATGDATREIIGEKSKIDPEPLPLDRNGVLGAKFCPCYACKWCYPR
ncbi:MAG: SWIM zinc finger family protein [Actinobacteria bacterium]|nr:SWIM zinc finger family protein [Actinomycetota bacterium]